MPSEQDAWPADLILCWDMLASRFLHEFLSEIATPASNLRIPFTFALSGKTLEFLVTRHPSVANQLSELLKLPSINWLAGLYHYSAFEIMDSSRLTVSLGRTSRITKSLVSKPAAGIALPLLPMAGSTVQTSLHSLCVVAKKKILTDTQYKVGDRVLLEEAAKSMRDLHIGFAASDFPSQYAKDDIERLIGKSVISAIDIWDIMTFKSDRQG
jgi:hypothetical protein